MTTTTTTTPPSPSRPRLVDIRDLHPWDLQRSSHLPDQIWARASRPDYPDWLDHIAPAAGCTRPIRLHGQMTTVEAATGRLLSTVHTTDLPDGVLYKPCGNRREAVCPACSHRYRRDAFHVFRSGLTGGGDIPTTVATHPALFVTLTAPSFGPVHTRWVRKHTCTNRRRCQCRAEPCHPRRTNPTCPHGTPLVCWARHEDDDGRIGAPLCPDCYDYPTHVVWNVQAGELWRRTTETLRKQLRRLATTRGINPHTVKLSYGKAAEMQRRGVVHFHTIIRLDGRDPDDPTAVPPPPVGITSADLVDLIEHAATTTGFTTGPHPIQPHGWHIGWGTQLDIRPINTGRGELTDAMVAGYLAKYATKSTEVTGHTSARLTGDTVAVYARHDGTHPQRLVTACWTLGDTKPWHRLRRWAHMLGFGGHFATKSRRFCVTFTHERDKRATYRRSRTTGPQPDNQTPLDDDTVLVVNFLQFVGAGWHTTGDALLANTSAALAREHQPVIGDEFLAHAA
jgi:hypothetical protein